MVYDTHKHVWTNESHYVESDDRRAQPGKCFFMQAGLFIQVIEMNETGGDSVTRYGVEHAEDEIVYEILYDLNYDGSFLDSENEPQTDWAHRYQIETDQAISMGDLPPIPFDER